MKWLKLALSLAVFVPACAVLGAFSTLDSGFPVWWGLTLGGLIGTFFGMVFGGVRGGIVGIIYPPGDDVRGSRGGNEHGPEKDSSERLGQRH